MDVKLKRLSENELELMMNWRMRPDISEYLFSSPKITLELQKQWYEKIKNDNTQIRWVIYYDDIPVGSIYLVDIDYQNSRCELGWFVAENKYRSLYLAMYLLWNMYDYIFNVLKLNRSYGYVLDKNKDLLKLLSMCGFETEGVMKQHVCKDGEFHDIIVTGITKDKWQAKKETVKYEKFIIE